MIRFRVNYRASEPPPGCWDAVVSFVESVTGERIDDEHVSARSVKEQNDVGAVVQVEIELEEHERPSDAIERQLRNAATAGEVDVLLVETTDG